MVVDSTLGSLPWDLSRKGSTDRQRYLDKAKESLKEALPVILKEVPLFDGSGEDKVAIPVDYMNIPHFVFGNDDEGDGDAGGMAAGPGKPGDVMGRYRRVTSGNGDGGGEAGTEGAEHGLEVVMSLDELVALVFKMLELPRLVRTVRGSASTETLYWNSRKRKGPLATLDKRETLKNALERSASAGSKLSIYEEDLRFRDWNIRTEPSTDAVMVLLRDVSGSMDERKTHLVRILSFWIVRWLHVQYSNVATEFWAHDVNAWRVKTAKEFFGLRTGGGTMVVPAYEAIHKRLDEAYPVERYNRYVMHLTDGDAGDVQHVGEAARALAEHLRWFGYAEVSTGNLLRDRSQLCKTLEKALGSPPFAWAQMNKSDDIAKAIVKLLEGEHD